MKKNSGKKRDLKIDNKVVFSKIHDTKVWGDGVEVPLSGSGSKPKNSIIYVDIIKTYISENSINSVLDFGHGSFEMWDSWGGEPFSGVEYLGIDLVEELSEKTNIKHGRLNRKFKFLDISHTSLPSADLLICKDVLQHLPTSDIYKLISSFSNYKSIIICNDIYIRGSVLFEIKEFIQLRKRLKLLLTLSNPFFLHRRKNNKKITAGQFRGINLEKKPFSKILDNFQIKVLADYDGPFRPGIKKRVYLLQLKID
jgi:hypothetical protein